MHDKKEKIITPEGISPRSSRCLLAIVITAAFALTHTACIMSWQYRVVQGLESRAGNRRYDPAQFKEIDAHALRAPLSAAVSFDELARYLAGPAGGELCRVRAIWRWITANIEYDNGKKNYSAGATLRDRRGTCQGYAELFVELCRSSGIRSMEITGYNRGAGYNPGDRVNDDHAWNAVLIDGKWHLLDCTDGAGFVRDGGFVRDYREHFFLTPPGEFIYGNMPTLPRWQLLPRKITRKEFETLPAYRHGFFHNNLRQVDDNRSCVIRSGRDLTLRFAAPPGVHISASARTVMGERLARQPAVAHRDDSIVITAEFPEPGKYHLVGWAGPEAEPRKLSWAFTFLVIVE